MESEDEEVQELEVKIDFLRGKQERQLNFKRIQERDIKLQAKRRRVL